MVDKLSVADHWKSLTGPCSREQLDCAIKAISRLRSDMQAVWLSFAPTVRDFKTLRDAIKKRAKECPLGESETDVPGWFREAVLPPSEIAPPSKTIPRDPTGVFGAMGFRELSPLTELSHCSFEYDEDGTPIQSPPGSPEFDDGAGHPETSFSFPGSAEAYEGEPGFSPDDDGEPDEADYHANVADTPEGDADPGDLISATVPGECAAERAAVEDLEGEDEVVDDSSLDLEDQASAETEVPPIEPTLEATLGTGTDQPNTAQHQADIFSGEDYMQARTRPGSRPEMLERGLEVAYLIMGSGKQSRCHTCGGLPIGRGSYGGNNYRRGCDLLRTTQPPESAQDKQVYLDCGCPKNLAALEHLLVCLSQKGGLDPSGREVAMEGSSRLAGVKNNRDDWKTSVNYLQWVQIALKEWAGLGIEDLFQPAADRSKQVAEWAVGQAAQQMSPEEKAAWLKSLLT
ncbi:hypothetical protein AURDEDRAFT_168817 [Auricularia subglabra TFB-10046 SS5]|nr:hypothetical protein AURDEDRAFT_168817 [Auricularia subglabra TFB-10046 SS5]